MFNLGDYIEKLIPQLKGWTATHYLNLALFNLILMILVLLRSAGYFDPYFPITIHAIILITLILLVFLLGVNSKFLFVLTCVLWIFVAFLKLVGIDVWAERTSVYAFEALLLGVTLFLFENIVSNLFKDKAE